MMEEGEREGTDGTLAVQAWADVYFWESTNVTGHLLPLYGAMVSEINIARLPFAGQDCLLW